MKIYKYIYLLCLMALQSVGIIVAQNTMQQPVDLGNKAFAFSYTDTKNTVNYTNNFQGRTSNDVFYKFTLVRAMDISIDHCGSGVYDTYLHVLNAAGQVIYSNDDDWTYQFCTNPMNSYLYLSNLPAGTYYVVSEGYSQNGNITTTIQGISPYSEIGSSMSVPIEMGSKAYSFEYSDTKNTADYINNFEGQLSNDVFYKFTLASQMDIAIDHCGSEVYDTYLHVLNASGQEIFSNDDDWEYVFCGNPYNSYLYISDLPAGTYYVVSEGYWENGNITTSIRGIRPLPPTGLYDGNAVTSPTNAGTNYILSITPTVATSDVSGLGVNESLQTVQYFDGLGRAVQTVQRGITPTKQDLATFTEYDGAGRERKQWLPIPSTGNGAIVPTANFINVSSLYSTEGHPYNEAIIEPSPLNRILGNKGPGSAWETKPTSIAYEANTSTDAVAYFYVNAGNNLVRDANNYAQGSLYKTVSKDEDGKTVEEYKDKLGQVVLKRSKNGTENVDTYFVNNDLGQLSYVIPPITADSLPTSGVIADSHGVLKRYGYLYKYDTRGNCIEKRLPGCGSIFMVYDKADRLILSQNSVQRAKTNKEWTVTKYDVFGRVLYTGITQNQTSHSQLIAELSSLLVTESVASSGTGFMETGYTCTNYAPVSLLSVNYYDNYAFVNLLTGTTKTNLIFADKTGYDKAYSATPLWGTAGGCKGLLTGTKTYTLGGTINDKSISAMYYDYRGRVVQTRSTNHLGGTDIAYNQYNFSGLVEKSLKEHTANGQSPITELYTNTYDHAGRLKTTYYKINTKDPILLVNNAYDELGRLIQKKRHNDTDTEEFDYNIRNWTTRLKSGTFEEKLYYNTVPGNMAVNATPCFNGNISASTWTYNNNINGYQYGYDKLNRYVGGYAYINNEMQVDYQMTESFVYDKQGNIKNLNRFGSVDLIDNLTLTYIGNQLKNVNDNFGSQNQYNVKEYQDKAQNGYNTSVVEMAYDGNGNLTKDLDRDIVTIKYNLLNLPEIVQFKNGNQITNTYDAGGQKLRTRFYTVYNYATQPMVADNTIRDLQLNDEVYADGTDYVGNVEYNYYAEYYSGELSYEQNYLLRLNNSEGYCQNTDYLILNY